MSSNLLTTQLLYLLISYGFQINWVGLLYVNIFNIDDGEDSQKAEKLAKDNTNDTIKAKVERFALCSVNTINNE